MTLFGGYSYDGVSAAQRSQILGWLVTLFGGYSYDGVSAAIGVQHTEVPNLGVACDVFWRLHL